MFQLVGPNELISFHGDGDFEGAFHVGFSTAKDLTEAANSHWGSAAGEGNDVLNPAAGLDTGI